ncbi:hypothetical protein G6F63_016740 [Rhizopus arrhizus]|nr:hypothetical protein G6F63_016740 [Rhizopus arrhizus]
MASSSDQHSMLKGGPAEAPSKLVMDKKIGAENHGGFAGCKACVPIMRGGCGACFTSWTKPSVLETWACMEIA